MDFIASPFISHSFSLLYIRDQFTLTYKPSINIAFAQRFLGGKFIRGLDAITTHQVQTCSNAILLLLLTQSTPIHPFHFNRVTFSSEVFFQFNLNMLVSLHSSSPRWMGPNSGHYASGLPKRKRSAEETDSNSHQSMDDEESMLGSQNRSHHKKTRRDEVSGGHSS